ncbi:MAG: carboxymuconolactone decarboxylase family protein [Hyphomicrobiales bacterium]|nr:carboxymuconolactone decarboxylase family protein [Hyphomicrobiales bacterium]
MPRIAPVEPANASPAVNAQYETAKAALGGVPNLIKIYGNSQHALGGFLALYAATAGSNFSHALREKIALAVGQVNGCDYCLSAHSAIARHLGVQPAQIEAARRGSADDAKEAAALTFAKAIADKRGQVSQAEFDAFRAAGWTEKDVVDLVAIVTLNVFTNFLGNTVETEIDFPRAAPLAA